MKFSEVRRCGVDIGNVIVKNGSYTSKLTIDNAELVPGSVQGVKFLVNKVGTSNVWIVSKASLEQQESSKIFLERFGLYSTAGLSHDHVRFCLERLDKAPIIKELDLQGHIDDRGEVIESIQNFVPCPVWFNVELSDYDKWNCRLKDSVPLFSSWEEFLADDDWK
jgi:hypothetical protein